MGLVSDFAGRVNRASSPPERWPSPRLFDRTDPLLCVAQVAILAAIGLTLIEGSDIGDHGSGGAVLCLLGIFAIHLYLPPTEALAARPGRGLPFLLGTSALFLLANSLTPSFWRLALFFVLTYEAFIWLVPAAAVVLIVPQLVALMLGRWLAGQTPGQVLFESGHLTVGVVFSVAFALIITNYYTERRRAEAITEQLALSNGLLRAANERDKAAAAIEERLRIARDIHDGLGHHLTSLATQLQVADKLFARDPDEAARALAASRREAGAALGAVRESVALLRQEATDQPAPDERLRLLVDDVARYTTPAPRFRREGTPRPLTEATATLLYRATQEGLTNARKYAAGGDVTVTLRYTPAAVALAIRSAGGTPGAVPGSAGGGFGLPGLRERAGQLDGTFSAGPDAGGFLLALTVPHADSAGTPA